MASSYPKFGKRHILAIWLFTGYCLAYILRVSINVAIVSMVNDTAIDENEPDWLHNDTCPLPEDGKGEPVSIQIGEFDWSKATQGVILSSFYYGCICTQFFGGYLARIIGGRMLFGISIGGTAALTLLSPIAARTSPVFLIILRVLEGLLEGVTMPSGHYLLGNWAPSSERTVLVSFPFSGQNAGTVLAALLTGLLCEYGFDGGWPSSFYVFGAAGLLWTVGWFYVVRDSPAKHPTITREERAYIEEHCQSRSHPVAFKSVPWKAIVLSPAVWAVIVAHTAYNWNFYTLLTEMPTYLNDVLHIPTAVNGLVTSIPYVFIWLIQLLAAFLADVFRSKGFKTKNVRKMSYSFGMLTSAACLIVISFIGCNTLLVIILLCASVGICGFGISAYVVNHVDLAPQYASLLMGVTNTFATLPGIVSPMLAGSITNRGSTITTWRIVFLISAGVSAFGAIVFSIFGDGEVQSWAEVPEGTAGENSGLLKSDGDFSTGHYVFTGSKYYSRDETLTFTTSKDQPQS